MRLFLQKTPKEERDANERLPYFKLVVIPEEEGGEWLTIGAFWAAKSGNGYSGKTDDGVVFDLAGVNPYKKPEAATGTTQAEPED